MTCITYTRELRYGSEISEADVARFQVTEDDLRRWETLLAYGKENDLAYLEAWDYRCDFYVEADGADDNGADEILQKCDFSQDSSRLEVMVAQQAIKFTGYEKHAGAESEWSTEPLKLADIANDLGVTPGTAGPEIGMSPLEPAAVADWLVDSLLLSPFGPDDVDSAEQLLIQACDELVFHHLGTSKATSDGVNNQGLEAQVEALLGCASHGGAPLAALVAQLRSELDALNADPSEFLDWQEKARSTLTQSVAQDEADNLRSVVLGSTPEELAKYAAGDLGLSGKSYVELRGIASERGLLDG